ncbi:frizzled-8-like [Ciona intestinalis]
MASSKIRSLLFVLLLITVQECRSSKCKQVASPMCSDIIRYPVLMPNMFGHGSQDEANLVIQQYQPLISVACSPFLKPFLCSAYFSPCMSGQPGEERKLPCRSLCKNARAGCLSLMESFGFAWPEDLRCDRFPEQSPTSRCIPPESFGL